MKRGLVMLLAAKAISDIGTALDFICVAVFVWLRTESSLAVAGVGLIMYGGGMLGGRLAHRYGDRWNRRHAMIAADVSRAAALLPMAVLPDAVQLWWLYPAVLVVGGGKAVFSGTLGAATPVLAGPRTQLVNSFVSGMAGVSRIAGMGLAAIAVSAIGYRGVFAVDAGTYVLSALVLVTLALPMRDGSPGKEDRASFGVAWATLLAVGVVPALAVRALDAFGSSSQHVGLPIISAQLDPADPARVTGLTWMMWALGMVACTVTLRPLLRARIDHAPDWVFYLGTVIMSAGFVGVFWLPTWTGRLAAAAVAGVGDSLSEVAFKQLMQRVPDQRRGSAFGLAQMALNGGFLSGLLITGLVVTPALVGPWVLLLHGIPTLAAVYAAVAYRTGARDRRPPRPPPAPVELETAENR